MKKIIVVMKKVLLGMSIIAFFVVVYACSRGSIKQMGFIQNSDKTMDEMKAEAKRQNKVLFVDVYTTWCGPCKWMDENTFKDSRVAEKFNKTFLNYKVDGESFEGVNVSILYRVDAFPTYLFISPDGTVINRIEGMMSAEALIKEADFVSRRNANSNATR
jgi:thioredoxin 1